MVSGRLSREEKKIVKEMRNNNKSYREIANKLKCKHERVQAYCKANDLGGFRADDKKNPRNAFDVFINNFNTRFSGQLVYVSGYTHCDGFIIVRCLKCGDEFKRNAVMARKNKKFSCNNCTKIKQKLELESKLKLKQQIKEEKKKLKEEKRLGEYTSVCMECDVTFIGHRKRMKYCSNECSSKHQNRAKELRRRKKVLINGDMDKDISLKRLVNKEKGICYICGGLCDSDDYSISKEGYYIVGKNYPSIEHVIPISKGGTHTWSNIKLAHHYCNTIKSDKNLCEESGQIILMI